MAKSIIDLKAEAYDIGKQLQELQKKANILVERNKKIDKEIDERESEKK